MPKRRPGRNNLCWCGSGREHKRCHLGRESQTPFPSWKLWERFNRSFAKKVCSAPNAWLNRCHGGVSRAHTVPRSSSLRQIARRGHVYSFLPLRKQLERHEGVLHPQLVGIRRASTFPGFCADHDNAIFAPLEKKNFSGTAEQFHLLGYRALAREMYNKRAASALVDFIRETDRGKSFVEQVAIQATVDGMNAGFDTSNRNLDYYKSRYDRCLVSGEFDSVEGYVIEFDAPPPVMCSGAVFPEQDFKGMELQDLGDFLRIPDLLCYASFYGGRRGAVVFSWLSENGDTCRRFIESLKEIPNALVPGALLRFFFEYCENVHMAPNWWEGLSKQTRESIIDRMDTSANPWKQRSNAILADDQVSYEPWCVVRRYEITSVQLGPAMLATS